ncbi:uncharacterized protein LOC115627955 [Scaptodrosophila lebanonensis]|uniref:Uncharacterized protein LOC115627955 n=1 Tax=Drosophila lebanonensis TaxID=7225 RepID=A0A6J2TUE5_DROLE|nr:uncharacterized protein LOC115627955 [Scaptodrosophila lebanonensis]
MWLVYTDCIQFRPPLFCVSTLKEILIVIRNLCTLSNKTEIIRKEIEYQFRAGPINHIALTNIGTPESVQNTANIQHIEKVAATSAYEEHGFSSNRLLLQVVDLNLVPNGYGTLMPKTSQQGIVEVVEYTQQLQEPYHSGSVADLWQVGQGSVISSSVPVDQQIQTTTLANNAYITQQGIVEVLENTQQHQEPPHNNSEPAANLWQLDQDSVNYSSASVDPEHVHANSQTQTTLPNNPNTSDSRLATLQRTAEFLNEFCENQLCNCDLETFWKILLLRRKLFDVRDYLLSETLDADTRDWLQYFDDRLAPVSARIDQINRDNTKDPMGFDLLTKIRHLFALGSWNSGKDSQNTIAGGEGGTAEINADSASAKKRRRSIQELEEDSFLIKYRRVNNTFPKYIPNDADEYNFTAAKPMATNRSQKNRFNPSDANDGQTVGVPTPARRSIFDVPQTIRTRVRNTNSMAVIDLSDDENNDRYVYSGSRYRPLRGCMSRPIPMPKVADQECVRSSSAVRPNLLYSDAVRHGTNGCLMDYSYMRPSSSLSSNAAEGRLNWYDLHNDSIVMQEDQQCDRTQYIDLINNMSLQEIRSPIQDHYKPRPPPVQRIARNGNDWFNRLLKLKPTNTINDEVAEYAKLIDKDTDRQEPTIRIMPPLVRCDSRIATSISSSSSISISSGSHSSESTNDCAAAPQPEAPPVIDLDDVDEYVIGSNTTIGKTANSEHNLNTSLTSLSQTNALQRHFELSSYFSDNFATAFSERCSRNRKRMSDAKTIAWQEAQKSSNERRAFEQGLREQISRLRIIHKPIFVIDSSSKVALEEEVEFPPMTDDHIKRYNELVHGPGPQVLVSKFSLNITRNDIHTLVGNRWLNDEVINFYMNMLTDRSERKSGKLPSVYAMNTFFVARLLQSGHSAVKRWTRKVDLFSKDIIPVPVHVGGVHWCMAIIHMRNKTIRYYDSMGQPNPTVLQALELYLHEESLDKRKKPFDMSDFKIESVADVPHQTNGSDCGVFSCMFAEYITRDKPLTFTQENMEYFRKKMILEICGGELWL